MFARLPLTFALIAFAWGYIPTICLGFYLPGVAPRDFRAGESMEIKVNKLASTKNQLPFDFYSIPFCRPDKIVPKQENLGEVLRGDRIKNSPFVVNTMENRYCNVLCRIDGLDKKQLEAFVDKIEDEYRAYMILDNLPLVTVFETQDADGGIQEHYARGFPVGHKIEEGGAEKFILNNHLRFTIHLHEYDVPVGDNKALSTKAYRVVGFEVVALSRKHVVDPSPNPVSSFNPIGLNVKTCPMSSNTVSVYGMYSEQKQTLREGEEVVFTYDVQFRLSDKEWATRWDDILRSGAAAEVHWFSIINSFMCVLFLTGIVGVILLKTLQRDVSNYNELPIDEEGAQEETGWKLIHGDVFRPPRNASSLAAYVGAGVQLLTSSLLTILFAVLGFLSPANRGGLQTAMVVLFVLMGIAGGYATARIYRYMKGDEWRKATLKTAMTLPGVLFGTLFVGNLFVWAVGSTAVPFGTLLLISFLWIGVSTPLVFLGSFFGFRSPPLEDPVRTNKIPRKIPQQPWWLSTWAVMAVGGVLPFGAVFIELFFIMSSMWLQQYYYLFGFLALAAGMLFVTCAEVAVVLTYFQLSSEDHRWWWRSFFVSGASAFWVFGYSVFYFYAKLEIDSFVPALVYFSTMGVVSYVVFVMTGTVGFIACYAFVRRLYSAVKID